MHVIYEALVKAGGSTDGDSLVAATRGMRWESPRGPMMIHAGSRDVVQNTYIRRAENIGGRLVNVEIGRIENTSASVAAR
jgi:branched-chain amino acid transport system substrate-binding protein